MYLYLYHGDVFGILPDPIEVHGEDLEDDNEKILDDKIDKGRCIK